LRPFSPSSALRRRAERLGDEFLAEVLGYAVIRRPEDVHALSELGHVLTRLGRFEEGLGIDRRLGRLLPEDPTVHYNLACSLALLGREEEALDALEQSIDLGYRDVEHMLEDPDLLRLRPLARFRDLARIAAEAPGD